MTTRVGTRRGRDTLVVGSCVSYEISDKGENWNGCHTSPGEGGLGRLISDAVVEVLDGDFVGLETRMIIGPSNECAHRNDLVCEEILVF